MFKLYTNSQLNYLCTNYHQITCMHLYFKYVKYLYLLLYTGKFWPTIWVKAIGKEKISK